jgi:predicted glycogen debranching enzyme
MIDCTNAGFEELSGKEWIVTNGIGGYASSSLSGSNTRRYHGVLVASLNPPTERVVVVSKIEETIFADGKDHHLSSNQYKNAIFPEGYKYITQFERQPLPRFTFKVGKAGLKKTTFMVYGSNTTVIEYENDSTETYLLKLNPLFVYRDYHSLWHEQPNYDFQAKRKTSSIDIHPYYGSHNLHFGYSAGTFIENRFWNRDLVYSIDKERGQTYNEDNYSLGRVEQEMKPGEKMFLIFSLDDGMVSKDPAELKQEELNRLNALIPQNTSNQWLKDLIVSGDQFIVQRRTTENYSVIAGYHWFTDWGRDSMIAIRGLCIAAGKQDIAKSVISTFLAYLKDGIIPNRFPDYQGDMAEYNTVDATLWLFVTLYEYDEKFKDTEFLKEVLPNLEEIIAAHIKGTLHNIQVTEKGLLTQGSPNIQLTWMDARIGDKVFTPRQGCPVEVNALWYNALRVYEHVCERTGTEPKKEFVAVRKKVEDNYVSWFWNRDGYLFDVVTPQRGADSSLRPNQIYAVSLPFSPLPEKEAHFVVESVRKYLLTPFGLRTLEPNHPDFKPEYSGDLWARDAAYHQGTVWPFLLPEFYFAFLKLHNWSDEAKKEVAAQLRPLKDHFYRNECIHGISEIFDGANPLKGKGCAQQAWSVSNLVLLLLRTGIEV